jgi:hypothetical protein
VRTPRRLKALSLGAGAPPPALAAARVRAPRRLKALTRRAAALEHSLPRAGRRRSFAGAGPCKLGGTSSIEEWPSGTAAAARANTKNCPNPRILYASGDGGHLSKTGVIRCSLAFLFQASCFLLPASRSTRVGRSAEQEAGSGKQEAGSLLCDAVEILVSAQVDLASGERRRGIESIRQLVLSQDLESGTVLQHHRRAIA